MRSYHGSHALLALLSFSASTPGGVARRVLLDREASDVVTGLKTEDRKTELVFRSKTSDAFKGVRISDYFRSIHEGRLNHMFYYQLYADKKQKDIPANLAAHVETAEDFMQSLMDFTSTENLFDRASVRANGVDPIRLGGLLARVARHLTKRDYVAESCKVFFLKYADRGLSASKELEPIPYGCPCMTSDYCASGLTCKPGTAGIVTTADDDVDAVPKLTKYMGNLKRSTRNVKAFIADFEASGQTLRDFVMVNHRRDWVSERSVASKNGEDVLNDLKRQFGAVGVCAP